MRFSKSEILPCSQRPWSRRQPQQARSQLVIAVPQLPTPKNVKTEGGQTGRYRDPDRPADRLRPAHQPAPSIPTGPDGLRHYTPTEAGAPQYPNWADIGAGALVTGYVQARDDGRITVACYLYDLKHRREMTRKGFVVDPTEWKPRRPPLRWRLLHRRHRSVRAMFDSRIAYVAATGSRTQPVKRIAIMNWDGHRS